MSGIKEKKKIFICGGGTGGHLYPALAVGQKLRQKEPNLEIIYIGSDRPIEKEIMTKYGEKFISLKIAGLQGRGLKTIFSISLIPIGIVKSIYLLLKYQPNLVIGFGGYSSGPMILAAWLLRKPRIILEQNVRPGLTNRLLRPFVPKVITAFETTLTYFGRKGIHLGNPVRPDFYLLEPRKKQLPFTLLIFGGSQGSHFLNQLMINTLPLLQPVREKIKIIHQTGSKDYLWVKNAYADFSFESAEVVPFFFEMAQKFKQADLIICRAGATSIAEIIASLRASLLIPFAQAAENHQYWNAYELFSRGAADLMLEKEASPEKLSQKITDYLNHPEKIESMEAKLKNLRKPDPAEKIASLCLDTLRINKGRTFNG
ncbi:MAG: undecaprenyldiphospho-muramoylpentapeptide beta-N-acetylglucosaminyltransferase [Candidatus Aminicenantes bacterium]|nr:undecaprenyldiphospho-muramoylpentapeptide beta-N-acetylglucosaminyltransferase [Candidatus Aminicenantes bacterium]